MSPSPSALGVFSLQELLHLLSFMTAFVREKNSNPIDQYNKAINLMAKANIIYDWMNVVEAMANYHAHVLGVVLSRLPFVYRLSSNADTVQNDWEGILSSSSVGLSLATNIIATIFIGRVYCAPLWCSPISLLQPAIYPTAVIALVNSHRTFDQICSVDDFPKSINNDMGLSSEATLGEIVFSPPIPPTGSVFRQKRIRWAGLARSRWQKYTYEVASGMSVLRVLSGVERTSLWNVSAGVALILWPVHNNSDAPLKELRIQNRGGSYVKVGENWRRK
ncbi:hypothetical protein BDZ94DRAFT_1231136 [Collybia nuda]|uniref:Uncharacterized protein n=1 Tax=Collybia nuda TaxID=64659 RepID=A0A9P6CK26_9AGAR|nr:hypothetical protein BDZ94DRAFT_1231136 [Collybia nuda]